MDYIVGMLCVGVLVLPLLYGIIMSIVEGYQQRVRDRIAHELMGAYDITKVEAEVAAVHRAISTRFCYIPPVYRCPDCGGPEKQRGSIVQLTHPRFSFPVGCRDQRPGTFCCGNLQCGKKTVFSSTAREFPYPTPPYACPSCCATLIERQGDYGRFLFCSSYPICRYTRNLDENGILREDKGRARNASGLN